MSAPKAIDLMYARLPSPLQLISIGPPPDDLLHHSPVNNQESCWETGSTFNCEVDLMAKELLLLLPLDLLRLPSSVHLMRALL